MISTESYLELLYNLEKVYLKNLRWHFSQTHLLLRGTVEGYGQPNNNNGPIHQVHHLLAKLDSAVRVILS
jgi:hypothetical protein